MMTSYIERISGFILGQDRSVTRTPIGLAEYVVLDTELTGLNTKEDSIISIGGVRMKGGSILLGETFYRLINPGNAMRHETVVIHGITPSDVAQEPSVEKVICELKAFCRDNIIVGHFISLDMAFINRDMKGVCETILDNRLVDTYRLYEWIRANEGSAGGYKRPEEDLSLFTIARKYGVPVSDAHNSLGDAFITAQIFQKFVSILPSLGVRTLGDLFIAGKG